MKKAPHPGSALEAIARTAALAAETAALARDDPDGTLAAAAAVTADAAAALRAREPEAEALILAEQIGYRRGRADEAAERERRRRHLTAVS